MASVNYNHLFYFWTVARQGSISGAATELNVSQPTISEQIGKLEETLGRPLFERVGRGLRLTDAGHKAFQYAENIFRLGREMTDALHGQAPAPAMRLAIGVARAVPTLVAYQLIAPALKAERSFQITCIQDDAESLYARLAVHQLDMVLSDSVMPATMSVRAYHHPLRRSTVTFFAARAVRPKSKDFPANLDGLPFLIPLANTRLNRALHGWFASNKVRPKLVGEFTDSALQQLFGQAGSGCFVAPSLIENEVRERYKVAILGRTPHITEEFYAVTTERRPRHPGVQAITSAARQHEGA